MTEKPLGDLMAEIDADGQLRLSACYQCAKCSSGCPMHFDTDLLPHQLVRLVHLGKREEALASAAIWKCASCSTCVSRCPMGVRTPEMIDALRVLAVAEGRTGDGRGPAFNEAFLASVERHGRVFEPAMLVEYKLRSGDLLGDVLKGPGMVARGKLRFAPPRGGNRKAVRRAFRGYRRGRR